ncbi:DUF2919 family protein [Paraglaciecola sp. Hal342]
MRLLLPLKYYDEAGRIKPANSFLWCLFFLCRPFWVFIASLTFRQDSGALLALFYPDNYYFYLSLGIRPFAALLVVLMISFRAKLWNTSCSAYISGDYAFSHVKSDNGYCFSRFYGV